MTKKLKMRKLIAFFSVITIIFSVIPSYAFSEGSYELVFDANGGTDSAITKKLVDEGIDIKTVLTSGNDAPSRLGYTFAGWGETPSSTSPIGSKLMPNASVKLYAIWKEIDISITGGSETAVVNKNVSENLISISGGSGSYSISVAEGQLPEGISVSKTNFTGTYLSAGEKTVTIMVKDDVTGVWDTAVVKFNIVNPPVPGEVIFPETNDTLYDYGTKLGDIPLLNGVGYGTFAWEDPEIIPEVVNDGYNVVYTPSDEYSTQNYTYPDDFEFVRKVKVNIKPLQPTVNEKLKLYLIQGSWLGTTTKTVVGKIYGVNGESLKGTYEYNDFNKRMSNVGTFAEKAVFKPENTNYSPVEVEITVIVNASSSSSDYDYYDVYASSSDGGKIEPYGTVEVRANSNKWFDFEADDGYEVSYVKVNGDIIDEDDYYNSGYRLRYVDQDTSIYVKFAKKSSYYSSSSSSSSKKKKTTETTTEETTAKLSVNTSSNKTSNNTPVQTESKKDIQVEDIFNIKDHIKYIEGYSDGMFKPNNYITRGEAAAIISKILSVPIKDGNNYPSRFSDVNPSSWYAGYVGFLSERGYINGYSNNTFKPEGNITRAEFTAIIAKALNINDNSGSAFSDVSNTHWAKGFINASKAKGFISGYSGNLFKPENNITRAEAVVIINRLLNRSISDPSSFSDFSVVSFSDVNSGDWYYNDVIEASNGHNYMVAYGKEVWAK